jgi:hypothetical protein
MRFFPLKMYQCKITEQKHKHRKEHRNFIRPWYGGWSINKRRENGVCKQIHV